MVTQELSCMPSILAGTAMDSILFRLLIWNSKADKIVSLKIHGITRKMRGIACKMRGMIGTKSMVCESMCHVAQNTWHHCKSQSP